MIRLRARWVLPIDQPAIAGGEVAVDGDKIAYCGPSREADGGEILDLGVAILMPGLVNAHTHIEYTMLRGFLEDIAFFPWIRTLMSAKTRYERDDWLVSARLGALECIAAGITTIGDNTDAGVSSQVASEIGLRARVYQEVFGIDQREPVEPILADLERKLGELAAWSGPSVALGVSPHAAYTVRPELLRPLQAFCERNGLPTSIHVAESPAETQLLSDGGGPFGEMFARRGVEWNAPGVSPTRYLSDMGSLTSQTLCVHCVHQDGPDIALVAQSGASIAHCPKSNGKLGAGIAPLKAWFENDALAQRVALGTDSAVSNNTHDLFEEMRFGLLMQRAAARDVTLSAPQMLHAATLGGARALGFDRITGSLTPGKQADIIAVRGGDVCLTMVNGRILYRNGVFTNVDEAETRRQAVQLRQLLSKSAS
jgi:cytosine/adenosine deaminase-related metal-dependent hydrolase